MFFAVFLKFIIGLLLLHRRHTLPMSYFLFIALRNLLYLINDRVFWKTILENKIVIEKNI